MKLRDLLNKKVELNSLLDSSPFGWMSTLYDRWFGKKMSSEEAREWWDRNKPILNPDNPIQYAGTSSWNTVATEAAARAVRKLHKTESVKKLKVQKDITSMVGMYGTSAGSGLSMEMVKKALINKLIEHVATSDAVEFTTWTQTNTLGIQETFISAEINVVQK